MIAEFTHEHVEYNAHTILRHRRRSNIDKNKKPSTKHGTTQVHAG